MSRLFVILAAFLLFALPVHADSWDGQFGLRGFPDDPTDGQIHDLVAIGGDLYAVGGFTTIGGVSAQCIARWDGNTWASISAPAFGIDFGTPSILTVAGTPDSLVVVGQFNTVGGAPGEMAIWNGSTWTGYHDPLLDQSQWLFSLAGDGSNIYIAGDYPSFIMKWDGSSFSQFGVAGGVSNLAVWDLLWYNGGLAACGHFFTMNGASATEGAFWDGASWTDLQPGVLAGELFEHNGLLYAAGSDVDINIRYLQNGQWFDAVSDNARCALIGAPTDAMFFDGHLYRTMVCGTTSPGGVAVNGVCKWTGSAWDNMDGGVTYSGSYTNTGPLEEYQDKLIVGGAFTAASGMPTPNHLAMWDGNAWYANAPDGRVRAVAVSGTDVYLAGDFAQALDTPASRVVRWDGNAWHAMGAGVNGTVHSLVVVGGDVYAGGEFTDADGSGAAFVARWDGNAWSPVGASLGGTVYTLATDGSDLYAGGSFLTFHTESLSRVARWDGNTWHGVGGGITSGGSVRTLVSDGVNLYAGGDFSQAAYTFTGNTAWFDGTSWQTLGFGFNATPPASIMVRAMAFHGGELYAAGDFTQWGLTPMNHIARWDGTNWNPVGDAFNPGVDGSVRALASSGGQLFAAGEFTHASGAVANRIVSWNGSAWSPLASGLDRPADALAMGAGELFVGGEFATAGGNGSRRFARWSLTPTAITAAPSAGTRLLEPAVPNPFNPSTQIRYRVPETSRVTIAIYDVAGRRVRTLLDGPVPGSDALHAIEWNGTDDNGARVASGVFFVKMRAGVRSETQKLVLLK